MKHNCIRCNGGLVVIEEATNEVIKTTYCKVCGLIQNEFTPETLKQLNSNVVKVGEDGKIDSP